MHTVNSFRSDDYKKAHETLVQMHEKIYHAGLEHVLLCISS